MPPKRHWCLLVQLATNTNEISELRFWILKTCITCSHFSWTLHGLLAAFMSYWSFFLWISLQLFMWFLQRFLSNVGCTEVLQVIAEDPVTVHCGLDPFNTGSIQSYRLKTLSIVQIHSIIYSSCWSFIRCVNGWGGMACVDVNTSLIDIL